MGSISFTWPVRGCHVPLTLRRANMHFKDNCKYIRSVYIYIYI